MTEICQKFKETIIVFEDHFRNGGDFSNLHLESSFTRLGKRRVRQTTENALESLLPAAKRDLGSPMEEAEGEAWAIEKLIFRLTDPTLRNELLTHTEDLFAIVVVSEKGDPNSVWEEWGASTLLAAAGNSLRMNEFLRFLYGADTRNTVPGRSLSWPHSTHQKLVLMGLDPDAILIETLGRAAQNADKKITEGDFFYPRKLVNYGQDFVMSEETDKDHLLPKQKVSRDINNFLDRTNPTSRESLETMLKGTGFTLKTLMFQIVHDGLNRRLYNGLAPDAANKLKSALEELLKLTEDDPILPLIHRPTLKQPDPDDLDGGNPSPTDRIDEEARDLSTGLRAADPGAATSSLSENLALLAMQLVKGDGFTDTATLGAVEWWEDWYGFAISCEPKLAPSFRDLATRGIALGYINRAGLAVLRGPGSTGNKALRLNATSAIGTKGAALAQKTLKWAVDNDIGQGDEIGDETILADAALRLVTYYRRPRGQHQPD
jgi:hypothetical protein